MTMNFLFIELHKLTPTDLLKSVGVNYLFTAEQVYPIHVNFLMRTSHIERSFFCPIPKKRDVITTLSYSCFFVRLE